MRILIAEDSVLFREGLIRLLTESGHEVVASIGDAVALPAAIDEHTPDLAIIDVRMPPTMTDDGARAAQEIRGRRPRQPILVLSQHIETTHSVKLVSTGAFGYLLKDRVLRVDDFLDALDRVAAGGSALDPEIVAALLTTRRPLLADLSAREQEVLALVAEGHSNKSIAAKLVVTDRTVETHMRSIFQRLQLADTADAHRRVLAVLAYLRAQV
ncbi:response regulator transcription factor [Kribbella sp. NPDC056951]|uniref:response regulator transcription factor n=1 Tax=Kribbella sp. NPDC056951 TaxID=3345978 RepID=UPI00364374CB